MYQVRYLDADDDTMTFHTYIDREANRIDLTLEEARAAAKRITREPFDGFAIIYFGGSAVEQYGIDPR